MPELPEVQTVVSTIRPSLVGRKIGAVNVRRPDIVEPPGFDLVAMLIGRTFALVERRGKRIVLTLDDGNRFYIHLGMSGQLCVCNRQAEIETHTHLIIDLVSPDRATLDRQLRFRDPRRFGGIFWLGEADPAGNMGPEPLTLSPPRLGRQLAGSKRPIKNALLDQTVIAGLGNIYVDESLFAAGIHPLTLACALTSQDIARLNRAIKTTLRKALRHRGSTLRDYRDGDGLIGGYQKKHRVYGREGAPCKICRRPIQRIVLGGRSTHFCPECQRHPN